MANSTVNEDPRLAAVEAEESTELTNSNATFDSMISESDTYFQNQIDAVKDNEATQTALQNQLTQQTVDEINQQKVQTEKDYQKEQSAAYVDWQKQSDQYGVNAEKMAANGMTNTGYSESSKVAMYTAYQNRVATAREVYNRAVLDYDNSIKEARLQNNVVLAEIAGKSLESQLALALEGFQYKNELLRAKADRQLTIKGMYHQQYQDVLDQINAEKAMEEEKRQFDAELKLAQDQLTEEKRQFDAQIAQSGSKGGSTGSATIDKEGETTVVSGTPKNNMQSILALGYGPISAEYLAELVASGKVVRSLRNGQYYYTHSQESSNPFAASYNRLKNMGLSK